MQQIQEEGRQTNPESNVFFIKYFNKWTQDRERNVAASLKKRLLLKIHISHHREKIPVSYYQCEAVVMLCPQSCRWAVVLYLLIVVWCEVFL